MPRLVPASEHTFISNTNQSIERENEILTNGYQKMVNNEEFSDFVFVVKGKTFYTHKVILAAVSNVFAAMFRSDMIEKKENKAIIDDIDADVFEQFLNFVYTGKSDKIEEMAEKLIPVADKYDIIKLKSLCEDNMRLDNQNVLRFLIIAYKHNMNGLKEKAIRHIVRNLKVIREQTYDEWLNLIKTYPSLADEVFKYVESLIKVREESEKNPFVYRLH